MPESAVSFLGEHVGLESGVVRHVEQRIALAAPFFHRLVEVIDHEGAVDAILACEFLDKRYAAEGVVHDEETGGEAHAAALGIEAFTLGGCKLGDVQCEGLCRAVEAGRHHLVIDDAGIEGSKRTVRKVEMVDVGLAGSIF